MARFSIILVFMIWLSWTPGDKVATPLIGHFLLSFGAMAGAIMGFGLYCRIMSRRAARPTFHSHIYWYNRMTRVARLLIPAWFAVIVYLLDYPVFVSAHLGPVRSWPVESPAFVLGTLPAVLAWVGIWWASYPAERAMREQNLLAQLDAGMPIYHLPTLRQYLLANVRMQMLFIYAPVLCILALRDVIAAGLVAGGIRLNEAWQLAIIIATLLPFIVAAPLLLIRILPTEPMPDSPLRKQLEELCRRNGLKVSNILLWKTGGTIGNAAVMGILPRVRYLLVTDMLLDTMSDEQILAVFAHEIGHVAHRHLIWMAASAFALIFVISGPVESGLKLLDRIYPLPEPYGSLAALAVTAPLYLTIFGWIVRRIERQADVFAARTVMRMIAPKAGDSAAPPEQTLDQSYVVPDGARLVGEALYRIAQVNNIPIAAHEWLHGSIASRMAFLRRIGGEPQQTWQFDQFMRRMYLGILVLALAMGSWTIWNVYR